MLRVHRAFSVLWQGDTTRCRDSCRMWAGAGGREKKGSQLKRWGGALLPFCGTTLGGGLKVARKLTSCPATAAAAPPATSHPGWVAISEPHRAWGEMISGSQLSSTFCECLILLSHCLPSCVCVCVCVSQSGNDVFCSLLCVWLMLWLFRDHPGPAHCYHIFGQPWSASPS